MERQKTQYVPFGFGRSEKSSVPFCTPEEAMAGTV